MCGRAKLEGDLNEIKVVFGIPPELSELQGIASSAS